MSEPHGPVLCATDLSEHGASVVDLAATAARALGVPLVVVHVLDTGRDADAATPAVIAPAERALQARVRERVEHARAELERQRARVADEMLPVSAEVIDGRPWEAVVAHATRIGATWIVIGPHGGDGAASIMRGSPLGWLLGTTADRVVRSATCPVLVAPRHASGAAIAGAGARWVVGIDYDPLSIYALSTALRAATKSGATIDVVHVVSADAADRGSEAMAEDARLMQATIAEALALVPEAQIGEPIVATGEPASTVLRVATERGASLVVTGTHGRRGASRVILGSVAERVLRHAESAVLVIPPHA